jgi:acyl-CoA synthetase (AMP-forming)/AMP-acid ligase II
LTSGPPLAPIPARVNVARLFLASAAARPDALAIAAAEQGRWREIRFRELEERVRRIAAGLGAGGVRVGDRVCLFVRPGIELVAVTYALFLLGAVPVLADPGMGRKQLLACMARVKPSVLVGIPSAQLARLFWRGPFSSVRLFVTVGKKLFWSGPTLGSLEAAGRVDMEPADTAANDPAAILFTSGSTGPPKGVLYTHANFAAQIGALRALYAFEPGEIDLACFPLFALFDGALGLTSVFPELDPSRPARCDPAKIVEAIERYRPTLAFGSPAIWSRVAPYCSERSLRLPSLSRILIAGAPVSPTWITALRELLPENADVHTPYGATEALPVTSISGTELRAGRVERARAGAGTCVGRPAPGIELALIRITDEPIERWTDDLAVALGRLGEVCVRGPVVTALYADDESATRSAKIRAAGGDWHRMGDVARLDDEGYLWFHGRLTHRLETKKGTRLPVPAENVFDLHPRVERTALVGVGARGSEAPLLVVQPKQGEMPRTDAEIQRFLFELRELGRTAHASSDVELFLFREDFPVDVRHNAKIDREALKLWAERELA